MLDEALWTLALCDSLWKRTVFTDKGVRMLEPVALQR